MPSPTIIIFTRYPEPGHVKTRLIPRLGPQGAADLYRKMVEHTLGQARQAAQNASAKVEVHYTGAAPDKMNVWLGFYPTYIQQNDSPDLGARMFHALDHALAAGAAKVILVGSDIPNLTKDNLLRALAALDQADVVFGPALDGGYWLVGLKRPLVGLFTNISWSAETTLAQSLDRARELGLTFALVDTLADLDRPQDLTLLKGGSL